MIKDECIGSAGSAWQETIRLPLSDLILASIVLSIGLPPLTAVILACAEIIFNLSI